MFSHRTSWNLAPNAFTLALETHRRQGRPILDLTASNPTQVGLQYETARILSALADPAALTYHPEPCGLPQARAAVADYYASRSEAPATFADRKSRIEDGVSITRSPDHPITRSVLDRIILTVSTSEAYSFVFRLLCNPGDEVLVPTPSYPLFEFLAGLHDVRLVPYSLVYDHGWQIDFHSVKQALTPSSRAIILVHPNNPTGSFVSLAERDQLNALCTERQLALVVDEVFLDYSLNNEAEPFSFAGNQGALTFTLSGVSKISGLPQMKLAWVVTSGPEETVRSAMSRLEVIADTYLSMNAPIQLAAPVLLEQRHCIREQLMKRVRANLAELDRQLAAQTLASRLDLQGGWYVIVRVPAIHADEDFVITLLEKRDVLVQPGYFYDFHADGYLVLSLITPETEFAEGAKRMLEFVIGDL